MTELENRGALGLLTPSPYLIKLRDHLKSRTKTWKWFAATEIKEKQVAEFKSDLLKNTYRMDKESAPELYDMADVACKKLAISPEITFYQLMNHTGVNASISSIGNEAHIVLTGPLSTLLDEKEMLAVIGHELTHHLMYKMDGEEFEVATRCINAMANDASSSDEMNESARVFNLYKELFCDKGAYHVTGELAPVISSLLKLSTLRNDINVESYLNQAKELLDDEKADDSVTHPLNHIRALSLHFLETDRTERENILEKLIQGKLDLARLDIFRQKELEDLTHRLIQCILSPRWIQSESVKLLAKQYFIDFYNQPDLVDIKYLKNKVDNSALSIKRYFSHVLLDFAMVDKELETAPIGYTLEISELLGIQKEYGEAIRKELKITVKTFRDLEKKAMGELEGLSEGHASGIHRD